MKKRMERQEPVAGRSLVWIGTDAECNDQRIGELACRYLREETTSDETTVFEDHLLQCAACEATVLNWWDLRSAAASLQLRRRTPEDSE